MGIVLLKPYDSGVVYDEPGIPCVTELVPAGKKRRSPLQSSPFPAAETAPPSVSSLGQGGRGTEQSGN